MYIKNGVFGWDLWVHSTLNFSFLWWAFCKKYTECRSACILNIRLDWTDLPYQLPFQFNHTVVGFGIWMLKPGFLEYVLEKFQLAKRKFSLNSFMGRMGKLMHSYNLFNLRERKLFFCELFMEWECTAYPFTDSWTSQHWTTTHCKFFKFNRVNLFLWDKSKFVLNSIGPFQLLWCH